MPELQVRSRSGAATRIGEPSVAAFRASLRGGLADVGSAEYESARAIWNAMIDRRPALIARCAGVADVIQAVAFAREHKLVLAVRGGGHNIAGNALCDDGLVIDMSAMKSVRIDPAAGTARVEAGVTLGEFDREAQAFALATPLGINSTTGVAGLTLGGGFGWLSRKHGLTIDNLISADVVTADGKLVQASERDNADLFWAIRGGGGNFGVVTSFEFRLHPVGPQVLAGLVVHPLDAAPDVLRFYRDFIETTPEEFVCWFVMRKAPPLPFLAPEWHGREILALAVCWSGELGEGERVSRPLRSFGQPIADVIAPMPYVAWQQILDPLLTPGMRNYWKSHDFRQLDPGLVDVLVEHARRIPDAQTEIAFAQLGGAVGRVPAGATSYTHRDANFVMNVHGRWADPGKDAECVAWARGLFKAATPFATGGAYVNFLTHDEQDRVRSAYGDNYERLVAIKNRYDPANLFCVNQNIRPNA
jgi:FAD/FMN-containing dehydrogenase